MKTFALLILVLIQSVLAGTPTEAVAAFKKAAQTKNFEETWKHTAKFGGLPDQITLDLKAKIKDVIELAGEGWEFAILEEKIEGDCAVVVTDQSNKAKGKPFDIDPVYLLKQDGEWRVFPDVTQWKLAASVAKDKVDAYKKLETWFKERKAELRKAHNG